MISTTVSPFRVDGLALFETINLEQVITVGMHSMRMRLSDIGDSGRFSVQRTRASIHPENSLGMVEGDLYAVSASYEGSVISKFNSIYLYTTDSTTLGSLNVRAQHMMLIRSTDYLIVHDSFASSFLVGTHTPYTRIIR